MKNYVMGCLIGCVLLSLIPSTSSPITLSRSEVWEKKEITIGVDFWDKELSDIMEYNLNYTIGDSYLYKTYFKRQNITLYYNNNESIKGYLVYYKKSLIENAVLFYHGLGCDMNTQFQYINPFAYKKHLTITFQQPEHSNLMFEKYNESYQYYNIVLAIMYYRILLNESFSYNELWTSGHSFGGQLAMWISGILDVSECIVYSSSVRLDIIKKYPDSDIWGIYNFNSTKWSYMEEYVEPLYYLKDGVVLLICMGSEDNYFPLECPLSEIERDNFYIHIYNDQGHFLVDFIGNVKNFITEEVHEKITIY